LKNHDWSTCKQGGHTLKLFSDGTAISLVRGDNTGISCGGYDMKLFLLEITCTTSQFWNNIWAVS
jgi:hypothetical protein